MKPDEGGRFCGQCQKTVIDFSGMTDEAVMQTMAQQVGNVCGRFREDQLNRHLRKETNGSLGYQRLAGLVTAGLLGWQTTQAQLPASKPNRVIVVDGAVEKRPEAGSATAAPVHSSRIITGRVVAESDSSTLAGVTVQLKGLP